ncbi:MAG: DUF47 domain-containing protein [Deltaproteobacteria bacterium]|nr:DUF47 domain-containing protein [Deltaproteobacteria bacterium]
MPFLPKSFDFYSGFEQLSTKMTEAAEELIVLLRNGTVNGEQHVKQLKTIENEADHIAHEALERLNKTFITPLDREDIHGLVTALDDVVDLIFACGGRFLIYRPNYLHPAVIPMAEFIRNATKEIYNAIHGMRNTSHRRQVLTHCIEVNRIENSADDQVREGLKDLFANEKDPIELIKIKEVLEMLEETNDACEDVAHRIEGIVLKN